MQKNKFILALALILCLFFLNITFAQDIYEDCTVYGNCPLSGGTTTISNGSSNQTITNASIFHNELSGLQGGSSNEYYHLNSSIYSYLLSNIFSWLNTSTADSRYLKLDQTTPQTVFGGLPVFNSGLKAVEIWASEIKTSSGMDAFSIDNGMLIKSSDMSPSVDIENRILWIDNTTPGFNWATLSIPTFSSDGFIKTSGGSGTLIVDTNEYCFANGTNSTGQSCMASSSVNLTGYWNTSNLQNLSQLNNNGLYCYQNGTGCNITNSSYYLASNPSSFYNSTTLQNLSQLNNNGLYCFANGTGCSGTTDLSPYAMLNGTNQPFTGNLNVSKTTPEIRLTSEDGNYFRTTRVSTGNNITFSNKVVQQASGVGKALNITANTQRMTFGTSTQFNGQKQITIGMWVNPSSQINFKNMWGWYDSGWGAPRSLRFFHENTGQLECFLGNGATSTGVPDISFPSTGTWTYIACTWQSTDVGGDGKVRIYKNGVLQGTATTGIGGGIYQQIQAVVGAFNGGNDAQLGAYDDIAIWNKSLSAAELLTIYNGGVPVYSDTNNAPFNTALEGLYRADEGTGTTVAVVNTTSPSTGTGSTNTGWSNGIVPGTSTIQEVPFLSCIDGNAGGESGICTLGYSGNGGTNLGSRTQINGYYIPLLIQGVQKAVLNSSGYFGLNIATPTALFHEVIPTATLVGQIIQGASAQTGDLLQFKNSGGTVLTAIDKSGLLAINKSTVGSGYSIDTNGKINSTGFNTTTGYSVGINVGLTQTYKLVCDVDLVGLTKKYQNFTYTGGILTSNTTCA